MPQNETELEAALRRLPAPSATLLPGLAQRALARRKRQRHRRNLSALSLLVLAAALVGLMPNQAEGPSPDEPENAPIQAQRQAVAPAPTAPSGPAENTTLQATPQATEVPTQEAEAPVERPKPASALPLGQLSRSIESLCSLYDLKAMSLSRQPDSPLNIVVGGRALTDDLYAELSRLTEPYSILNIRVQGGEVMPGAMLMMLN